MADNNTPVTAPAPAADGSPEDQALQALFASQYGDDGLLAAAFTALGIRGDQVELLDNNTFSVGNILRIVQERVGLGLGYAAALQCAVNGIHARAQFKANFMFQGNRYDLMDIKSALSMNPITGTAGDKDQRVTFGRLCRAFAPMIQMYLANNPTVYPVLYRKAGRFTGIPASYCFVGSEYVIPVDSPIVGQYLQTQARIDAAETAAGLQAEGEYKWENAAISVFIARGADPRSASGMPTSNEEEKSDRSSRKGRKGKN
jgi:hypothetical protein